MYRLFHLFFLLSLLSLPGHRSGVQQDEPTSTPPEVTILSPPPGAALQGSVPVTGNTAVDGFLRAELTFAYTDDPTNTWFLLFETDQPTSNSGLTQWDTTTLTDGEYSLRLVVTLQDGTQQVATAQNLRLRNYTPIETNTPAPTQTRVPGDTPIPTQTPAPTITPVPPTSTPLPPNPAQLTSQDVAVSLGKGAIGAIAALGIIGFYVAVRNAMRR
jgi:hypothetical protein